EFINKFIVHFEYLDEMLKGELDRLVIDHSIKIITPVDFKTTSKPIYSFNTEFWKYRYDFQAATYTLGLKAHPLIKELLEKGYTLNSFKYIVVEKDLLHNPMVFNVPDEVINIGINGGERKPWKI